MNTAPLESRRIFNSSPDLKIHPEADDKKTKSKPPTRGRARDRSRSGSWLRGGSVGTSVASAGGYGRGGRDICSCVCGQK